MLFNLQKARGSTTTASTANPNWQQHCLQWIFFLSYLYFYCRKVLLSLLQLSPIPLFTLIQKVSTEILLTGNSNYTKENSARFFFATFDREVMEKRRDCYPRSQKKTKFKMRQSLEFDPSQVKSLRKHNSKLCRRM